MAIAHDARKRVMTVGKNVGLDRHPLAKRALAREAAPIDLG